MLALLVGLGVWQIERLHWKVGLLAQIDRGESEPPVPLTEHPPAFRRVTATGVFGPEVGRYGAEVRATVKGPEMGAQLISPLMRPGQRPVLVDRGWAPLDGPAEPPSGPSTVEGYIRPPEHPTLFGINSKPSERRFYALDPAVIGPALGMAQVAPFTLVAMGPPGGTPEPATRLPRPPNDHLSYAITWFGLAAALLVVFVVYVRQVIQRESAE